MKNLLVTATIAAFTFAGTASAQGFAFEGAELSFKNVDSDQDYSGQIWSGSAEVSFGAIGAQLDYVESGYDGGYEYRSIGLHLNYSISPEIVAGLFYTQDDWLGDKYRIAGLEAQYDHNQLSIEAAAGNYTGLGGLSYDTDFARLDVSYDLGNGLSALVLGATTSGSDEVSLMGLGVRYERNGIFVESTLSQMSGDYDQQLIGIEIGYAFGGGTTFEARDWNNLIEMY